MQAFASLGLGEAAKKGTSAAQTEKSMIAILTIKYWQRWRGPRSLCSSPRPLLALCALALSASQLIAEPPVGPSPPTTPTIQADLGGGQLVIASANDNIFPLVGVQPGQTVQVPVQYPVGLDSPMALGHMQVQATPLDGGTVSFPPGGATINAQGTITFAFTAAQAPGLNQVSLQLGSTELGVQFWVFDQGDPTNNPPTAPVPTLGPHPPN